MNVESGRFRSVTEMGTGKILELAEEWIARQTMIEDERRRCHEIQEEIKAYMNSTGATALAIDGLDVKLDVKIEYDKAMLTPLLEYEEIPAKELENARTPEKIIPPSWNMTKVKPLAKYSKRCADIIDSSKFQSEPVLKISKR